jgi:hypothetical protein
MESQPIRFVVCAYGIGVEPVRKFVAMNEAVFLACGAALTIVMDTVPRCTLPGYAAAACYPVKQEVFNFAKTINYGIRHGAPEGIVVKTDIDMLLSTSMVEHTLSVVDEGHGLVCLCANSPSDTAARKSAATWPTGCVIRGNGHGGYFALSYGTWDLLYGYDERMFGWGTEDKDMYDRASRCVRMEKSNRFPLFHINHKRRLGQFFPYRSGENHAICKRGGYVNPSWGTAKML